MTVRDREGFYAALNVAPTASQLEIRLAYKFLKRAHRDGKKVKNVGKIRSAYTTLSDPKLKAQYDRNGATPAASSTLHERRSPLNSVPALMGSAALLLIALVIALGPAVLANWVSFDVGDDLIWKQTLRGLGEVLSYEEVHDFPEAATSAAYEIQMSSGVALWFAADELHRGAKVR